MTAIERMLLAYSAGFLIQLSFNGSIDDCILVGSVGAGAMFVLEGCHTKIWRFLRGNK